MKDSMACFNQIGYIEEKRIDRFAVNIHFPCGVVTSDQLEFIAEVARQFGEGTVRITLKQGIEITGIPANELQAAHRELARGGLTVAPAGRYIDAIVACCGDQNCCNGLMPTQPLADRILRKWQQVELPNRISIAIAGCPNACTAPLLADIGVIGVAMPEPRGMPRGHSPTERFECPEGAISYSNGEAVWKQDLCTYCGQCIDFCDLGGWKLAKKGFAVYLGGQLGRHPRLGTKAAEFLSEDETAALINRALDAYRQGANPGEKFADFIQKFGIEKLK